MKLKQQVDGNKELKNISKNEKKKRKLNKSLNNQQQIRLS